MFNNILNESNQEGWTQLQTVGSGSQTLLQNAERYGTYLATTVNSPNEPLVLVRENIGESFITESRLLIIWSKSHTLCTCCISGICFLHLHLYSCQSTTALE